MRKFPVILDLETKHTFRDFQDHKDLGVSIACIYDYKDQESKAFLEPELPKLFPILENASYVIGYNIKSFDLPVLAPYYPGNINHFSVFDILDDIKAIIGRRLALNDIIKATLDKKKTGHGLMAIDFYKEKKWDELKKYCQDDVFLTKDIFAYGVKNGELFYLNEKGKVSIKVEWKKYMEESGKSLTSLTLPF